MRKFLVVFVAVMMCVTSCLADCACMTDETRVALFDLMGVDGLDDAEEHDAIVAAYLGMDCKCSDVRLAVVNVLCRNYELITEKLSESKLQVLMDYVSHCCCGCDDEDEPESTATPTDSIVATCKHSGGTHENGGVCVKCGRKYQLHKWSSWTSTSNVTGHKRTCSCGFEESGKHKFVAV